MEDFAYMLLVAPILIVIVIAYFKIRAVNKAQRKYLLSKALKFEPLPRAMRDTEVLEIVNSDSASFDLKKQCRAELERRGLLTVMF